MHLLSIKWQDIADEWGMGMNGDQILPIHPKADEWG